MEHLLHTGLQRHRRRRLRHPVHDIRDAENPDPALLALLGYLHRPDRPGEIRPRRHPIPQPIEVPRKVLLELLDRHAVSPGRSAILLDLQPRIPHQPLGDDMRLALQLRLMHAIHPFRLTASTEPGQPRPLAPPPLRYAEASQLLRASPPACPATVLCSSRILPLGALPLAADLPAAVSGLAFTRSIESLDRAHAACMPDAAWAVNGYPPGSSQDKPAALVSTSSNRFRHVNGRGLSSIAHLPDPHLTRSQPRLFPRRSPQRSSANAECGRFEASPAGRLQRARQPPSLLQHRSQRNHHQHIDLPPAFVFTTSGFGMYTLRDGLARYAPL